MLRTQRAEVSLLSHTKQTRFEELAPITSVGSTIEIGYWPFAGRQMPVLLLLEILEVEYSVRLFDQNTWFGSERDELQLDFPNLPLLIDNQNGLKLTEVHNIINYILQKFGRGKNLLKFHEKQSPFQRPLDEFRIDEIRFILNDVFTQISSAVSKHSKEDQIKHATDTVVPKLEQIRAIIEKSNNSNTTEDDQYFVLGYLTVVDTYFYIIVKYFEKYFLTLYAQFDDIFTKVLTTFESIPQIAKYISSNRFPPIC